MTKATRAAASDLCDTATRCGARPMLARGLRLAGRSEEAAALARALGMGPLEGF